MFRIQSMAGSSTEVVTDFYMNIIYEACLQAGLDVAYFSKNNPPKKSEFIVVATILDALKYWAKGYKNIMIWFQGVSPEESFMRNSSKLRSGVLSIIEKFILKKSKYLFVVSDEMVQHFKRKYAIDISDKCFVMPCFNTSFQREIVEEKNHNKQKVFTYVGSLSVWQCFEETLDLYKKIEDELIDCELRVFTFSIGEAIEKIQSKGIKNYSVECVPNEELPVKLKDISYGFVIRDDNIVNRVATPTKLSTYLSCGVIPIFSDCLTSFFELSKTLKYALPVSSHENDISNILNLNNSHINFRELEEEYEAVFNNYYSKDKYIKEIGNLLTTFQLDSMK